MIETVAPAKTIKPSAPLFEERNHLRERVECFHTIACVIATARMRPSRVALLASRSERDDLGFAFRPARASERDVERKKDLVKARHLEPPLSARDSARDEAGEVDVGAAKALGIRRRDVDGDAGYAAGTRGYPEPPVRPARERHNRFRSRFARN